jgi:DNA-directed RNA polymerase beta subunit
MDRYFEASRYRATQHQLDSYDDFLNNKIPAIVAEGNRSFVMLKSDKTPPAEFRIEIRDLALKRAEHSVEGNSVRLLPNVCRALGVSYAASVQATVVVHVHDIAAAKHHAIEFGDCLLCRIPVMLHSSACYLRTMSREETVSSGEDPDDPGGYFIAWGAEKVIVTQERGAPNVPVTVSKPDETVLGVRSALPHNTVDAVTTLVAAKSDGTVSVRVPGRFLTDVDVCVIFRALGVETDGDIVRHVAPGDDPRSRAVRDMLRPSLVRAHGKGVWTQEHALAVLAPLTPYGSNLISIRSDKGLARGRSQALYILRREMLKGVGEDFGGKAVYLGLLVKKALLVRAGMEAPTDREALSTKRLYTAGMLLTEIFSEAYQKFKTEALSRLDRAWYTGPWRGSGDVRRVVTRANVGTIFGHEPLTSVFQSSMRGNWGKHGKPEEGGIVQDLSRLSWLQFLSHLRRTNHPLDRDLKILEPHYLHSTQWGALCPIESPDGGNIGLTNNLAITCEVTSSVEPGPAIEMIRKLGGRPLAAGADGFVVYVNGVPSFLHGEPAELASSLRGARRKGELHHHASVRLDVARREVRLSTDGGRCSRPLIVANGAKSLLAGKVPGWAELVSSGTIEYVDADETEDVLIAWDVETADSARHTHAEMHATAGLSLFETTMPFMQHNPSPRNVLAAQQGKQSAGLYTSAFRSRIDTAAMVLNYPQAPIVTTRYEDVTGQVRHPSGANAIVAIMAFTGYNMEDGVIINRSSVERGLFGMTYYKNLMEKEEVSIDGVSVRFGNPTSAASLDKHGMPRPDEPVVPGDLLVGKMRRSGAGGYVPVDGLGVRADETWSGCVTDRVFVYDAPGEEHALKVAKVRYRKMRAPRQGDKLAARHAQKGVVAALIPESLMPFTEDGIVPDIVINPHAIPSRMTIGQLMECLCAKSVAVASCERVDGTAFVAPDFERMKKDLLRSGLDGNCNEVMYNMNGRQLQADVFVGPTYYQRLKQMVEDKINYRGGKGARDNVTNQPVGGRARGGGLRMGEMEYNGVLAHGVMGMAAENTSGRSDGTSFSWSDGHGAPAIYNESVDYFRSTSAPECDKRFYRRGVPRAFLALQHELAAMGVDVRLSGTEAEQDLSEDLPRSCGKDDPFSA